ncbi:unnamed protein product [Rotaria socialis]|uniref:Uncharacterized protein n=1 Tax=Rotaria socialis TaxID=392032 RepID=A0A818W2G3_9BILA|nr:unnamed protein product [Rotaria socialis]CAF3718923.1 unnamed protein product [Rotaria socialis]CAF4157275.1 unnamed protein product [Rotaria socialis]CAF4298658.1 unnamed protein product [Rotaria socialis]CAF4434657.1 unnamed protein product [Rotaria socialis]
MTFGKQEIAASLRNIDSWIGILKRVMIRVLSNVNVDTKVSEKKHKPSPTDIDGEQEPKSVETSTAKVTSWMGPKGRNSSTQVKVIQTSGAKAKKRIA